MESAVDIMLDCQYFPHSLLIENNRRPSQERKGMRRQTKNSQSAYMVL
jgi:hypothetical protein